MEQDEQDALADLLAEMPESNEVYLEFLESICYEGMQDLLGITPASCGPIPVARATPSLPAPMPISLVHATPRVPLPAKIQQELDVMRRNVFLQLQNVHAQFGVTVYGYIDGSKYSSPACACVCGHCLHCLHRTFHR